MMISRKVLFILVALVTALSLVVVVYELYISSQPVLEETFQFGGVERTYYLHVPSSYNGRTSMPLVIVLHGYTQSPTEAQTFITIGKSDKEGFIVVYPEGLAQIAPTGITGTGWNVGFGFLKFDTDDVAFINEIINRLEQKYKIDPKRIYVTGLSNGAMLSYLLGAELSNRIAAIAPVAGTIGAITNNVLEHIPEPSQPVSVIVLHGTADTSIPYNGGAGFQGIYLSVAESVAFWVRYDGCSTNALNETSSDGKVIKSTYTGGTNGTEVVLYTLVGVGHVWPTSPTYYIMATDVIWDFFESHPKQ